MELQTILMLVATLFSPLIAVQVTRYLDETKERRSEKVRLFKILMATRAATVSPIHVEALNLIDLEFSSGSKKDRQVISAWHQYFDILCDKTIPADQWSTKRTDMLAELLHAMSQALDYTFEKTQIKNAVYFPTAHGRLEEDQEQIRRLCLEVLKGDRSLKIIPQTTYTNEEKSPEYKRGLLGGK